MEDCVFCKIVRGDIPSAKLVETHRVVSFLDVNPVNRGHALVTPKEHVENLLQADPDDLKDALLTVRRVAGACVKATGAEGFNVLQNNGRCAGQVVDHLHFHVIPRSSDDGFRFGWRQGRYEEGELDSLCVEIVKMLEDVVH